MQIPSIPKTQAPKPASVPARDVTGSIVDRLDQFSRTGTFGPGAERDQPGDQDNQLILTSSMVLAGACQFDEDPNVDGALGEMGKFHNERCSVQFDGPKDAPTSLRGLIHSAPGETTYLTRYVDEKTGKVQTAACQQAAYSSESILIGMGQNPDGTDYVERLKQNPSWPPAGWPF